MGQKAAATIIGMILLVVWCPIQANPLRQVTDQTGRIVKVPVSPKRVVALAPSITEIIYALNQQEILIGVTQFSDYPKQAEHLAKVGSYVNLDLERIISLKPDLCIAIKDGNPKKIVDRLTQLGIAVYAINPLDIETMLESFERIGRLLNVEKGAQQLVADTRKKINLVRSLAAKAKRRPRVFVQIGISPIYSVGSRTFIHQLILLAGGRNVAEGNRMYPQFSMEEVIELAPDIIVVTTMARSRVFEEVKQKWSRWKQMPAARHDRIYLVDSNLFDRPTPRLIQGLEILAKKIHPDLFGSE